MGLIFIMNTIEIHNPPLYWCNYMITRRFGAEDFNEYCSANNLLTIS